MSKKKKKMFPYINKCHSCGKETGIFLVSQWLWGLIKHVHCIDCVNKKFKKQAKKKFNKKKYKKELVYHDGY